MFSVSPPTPHHGDDLSGDSLRETSFQYMGLGFYGLGLLFSASPLTSHNGGKFVGIHSRDSCESGAHCLLCLAFLCHPSSLLHTSPHAAATARAGFSQAVVSLNSKVQPHVIQRQRQCPAQNPKPSSNNDDDGRITTP